MKIAISWNELPKYAAYLLREIVQDDPKIEIVSIKSPLPIENLEQIIKKKIHWINNEELSWKELGLDIPDIFFQAGWYKKSFSSLGKAVKKNGGKVILLSDNQYEGNLRQFIGSIIYRIKYSKLFDAIWVPGKSGQKLMNYYGNKDSRIFTGLYSSNEKIYFSNKNLVNRSKSFLFVGNLIENKGFRELIDGFKKFSKNNPDWTLTIVGQGPLKNIIPKSESIFYKKFSLPEEIADIMRVSRFLVLPSKTDHWPLVVNEAALSGCGLILSNKVGNIPEFSNKENSILFYPSSVNSLLNALKSASKLSDKKLEIMHHESLRLSSFFMIINWVNRYHNLINSLDNKG